MSTFLLTAIFGTRMQPSIASENMSKDCYIQTFGMLVPKLTAHWKVNNKKKTNVSLEYIKY